MKRYKVTYYREGWSKVDEFYEFSKSGKWGRATISFFSDGRKYWQFKCKNDLLNGIYRSWRWNSTKNSVLQNRKKGATKGIIIKFHWK